MDINKSTDLQINSPASRHVATQLRMTAWIVLVQQFDPPTPRLRRAQQINKKNNSTIASITFNPRSSIRSEGDRHLDIKKH